MIKVRAWSFSLWNFLCPPVRQVQIFNFHKLSICILPLRRGAEFSFTSRGAWRKNSTVYGWGLRLSRPALYQRISATDITIWCQGVECVELYLRSPIRFHVPSPLLQLHGTISDCGWRWPTAVVPKVCGGGGGAEIKTKSWGRAQGVKVWEPLAYRYRGYLQKKKR
jgi:hypothetical protein